MTTFAIFIAYGALCLVFGMVIGANSRMEGEE